MSLRGIYRGMPSYLAMPVAVLASATIALALAALGVSSLYILLQRLGSDGTDGPGGGVLLILVALNIAVSAFVAIVSTLVNFYRPTSWLTPTVAFAACSVVVGIWAPFRFDVEDMFFAPLVLGTGAIAWLTSCWFLHRRSRSPSRPVAQA